MTRRITDESLGDLIQDLDSRMSRVERNLTSLSIGAGMQVSVGVFADGAYRNWNSAGMTELWDTGSIYDSVNRVITVTQPGIYMFIVRATTVTPTTLRAAIAFGPAGSQSPTLLAQSATNVAGSDNSVWSTTAFWMGNVAATTGNASIWPGGSSTSGGTITWDTYVLKLPI